MRVVRHRFRSELNAKVAVFGRYTLVTMESSTPKDSIISIDSPNCLQIPVEGLRGLSVAQSIIFFLRQSQSCPVTGTTAGRKTYMTRWTRVTLKCQEPAFYRLTSRGRHSLSKATATLICVLDPFLLELHL